MIAAPRSDGDVAPGGTNEDLRLKGMEAEAKKTVVALLNDLMFQVRIQEAAKRAGLPVRFVKSQAEALALARERPALLVLDLNYAAGEPLDLIVKLKAADETRAVPLIGYISHVQTELRREAIERGCDRVLARSAFVGSLPELLAVHSTKN